MADIILLDELTINKIAAGEVIERPASVVKELVENSIDANANKIDIEIENGGIKQIRITDNGKGIKKEDLEIAFERHATSKIRVADDLTIVKSMGFRGEALASIAAISNVELLSKTEEQETGNKIIVEGGNVLENEEIGCRTGTTIVVKNLFYNTPVRYKFLKRDYTESGYIEEIITRLALANPNISFKLINNGKTIIQTNGDGNLKSVVYCIYGKEIAEKIVNVNYFFENIEISGIVGKPEIARNNKTNQIFFVNKRFVKDKTLSAAVEQAFKGFIPIGKFGFAILNLDMNPQMVDVNVHPAKLEVRFANEQAVFKSIYHAIRESILKGDIIKNIEKNEEISTEHLAKEQQSKIFEILKKEEGPNKIEQESEKVLQDIFNKRQETIIPSEEQVNKMTEILNMQKQLGEVKAEENVKKDIQNIKFEEMYIKAFGKLPHNSEEETKEVNNNEKTIKMENISVFEEKTEYIKKTDYKFIGIAFATYIILEIKDELYLMDQHAAHERIIYEKVKKNYYSEAQKDSQIMLLPDIIELTHKEKELVKENFEMFIKAGFIVEEFGENTIKLIGVPNLCMELDTKELFLEILDEMDTFSLTKRQEKEDKFIATIACKIAVKAKMNLAKEEVESLLDKLFLLSNPFSCPHGRPTVIKYTKGDLERKFNRK